MKIGKCLIIISILSVILTKGECLKDMNSSEILPINKDVITFFNYEHDDIKELNKIAWIESLLS